MTMDVPVNTGEAGQDMRIEARMNMGGSMESCGRRLRLFGRLTDEHNFAQRSRKVSDVSISRTADIKEVRKKEKKPRTAVCYFVRSGSADLGASAAERNSALTACFRVEFSCLLKNLGDFIIFVYNLFRFFDMIF